MVSPALNPQACWEFQGEILVLHHPTTISSRYQAMGNKMIVVNKYCGVDLEGKFKDGIVFIVHCGSIRQTASILSMSQECLRTGDKALVHFRFIKHPEYVRPGQRMVFREGRTKAVGNVLTVIPQSANTQPVRGKTGKLKQQNTNNNSATNIQQVRCEMFQERNKRNYSDDSIPISDICEGG